ncbi:hypothetical protein [Capybara microvirus Cap3_SP_478]|nr:hypothetical protein [Capybara microvirus Cap3_SP_478]
MVNIKYSDIAPILGEHYLEFKFNGVWLKTSILNNTDSNNIVSIFMLNGEDLYCEVKYHELLQYVLVKHICSDYYDIDWDYSYNEVIECECEVNFLNGEENKF